jgi:hypothetical protein
MTTKRPDRLATLIKEVEALAKRLRADMRRAVRDTGLARNLEQLAKMLRKQAALLAAEVERRAHALRLALLKGTATKRPEARRRRAA